MNHKLSALLTTAIVTGLLTAQVAKAEDNAAQKGADAQMAAEKNGCKGQKAAAPKDVKKKKKGDKNSCKNSCGESKDKAEQNKE